MPDIKNRDIPDLHISNQIQNAMLLGVASLMNCTPVIREGETQHQYETGGF